MKMSASDPNLVSIDQITAAAERVRGVAARTPLIPLPLDGRRVWLKCESFQPMGAFKLRGAYNFIRALPEASRKLGVITYSSGNHAQGVALAARTLGIHATVVMPTNAPPIKIRATRELGAEVEFAGSTSQDRKARAEEILAERGGVMVPPFDHPEIIAGQGTAGLEIVEQLEEARALSDRWPGGPIGPLARIAIPIGGGGLLSGVSVAIRSLVPDAAIFGVEPAGAAKMTAALSAGAPVTLDGVDTIADGLRPVRAGDLTFEHCRSLVDRVITVTDDEIVNGLRWCFHRGLVVEPSGAATVGAALAGKIESTEDDRETVLVISGGNVEPSLLLDWVTE